MPVGGGYTDGPSDASSRMNMPSPPDAILLATDLSARSDRAQARAVQLARQWQARLVVLVAVADAGEFSRPNSHVDPDAGEDAPAPETVADYAARIARRDLAEAGVPVEVRVVTGAPGPAAQEAITDTGCGLCVTGTARADVAMRMDPGSTVRWLSRHASVPLLVVQDRAHGPYARITVASDLSDCAGQALRVADSWFQGADARTVLHAHEVPLAVLSLDDATRAPALKQAGVDADARTRAHLEQVLGEASGWQATAPLGGPIRQAREHARRNATELTVIGSHGRSALMDRLLGSVAQRMIETTGTDLLLVRPPAH